MQSSELISRDEPHGEVVQATVTPPTKSWLRRFGPAILSLAVIVGGALAYTLGMSSYFAFDQDEVLQHHALACWYYPLNTLNNPFPAGCGLWWLRLPGTGTMWPLRSYQHVGVLQSVLYFPLFLMWKHPYSARLFGILLIGVQAFFLSRTYKRSPVPIFLGILCLLPYTYHHLVDIGHLTVHTMLVCAFQLLLFKFAASSTRPRDLVLSATLGLILAVGVHVRISFLFLVPALLLQVGVFFIVKYRSLRSLGNRASTAARSLLAMAAALMVTFVAPTLLIFFSIDVNSAPYYMVMVANSSADHVTNLVSISQKFAAMSGFLTEPMRTAHILLTRFNSPEWVLAMYTYGAMGFFVISVCAARTWQLRGWIVLNLFCAVLSVLAVSTSSKSYGAHNAAPCLVFVISAAVAAFSGDIAKRKLLWRSAQVAFLACFLAANLYCYKSLINYSSGAARPYHRNLPQLFEFVNENYARSHLQVTLDWNSYYTKSLYGPKEQAVLCFDGLPPSHYALARDVAAKLGRNIIFITNYPPDTRIESLRQTFPQVERVQVPFDVGGWQLWVAKVAA